jgi:sugar phosphate isomerase/epimerase
MLLWVRPSPWAERLGYRYVQIGDGEIPLKDALRILKAAGFDGWLTFEWEKIWHPNLADPSVAFPEFITRIRALLASA